MRTDCDSSSDESDSEGHISQSIESNIQDSSIPRADPIEIVDSPNRPCSPLPTSTYSLPSQEIHSSVFPHGNETSNNGDGFDVVDLGYALCNGEINIELPTAPADPIPFLSTSIISTQTNSVHSLSNVVNSFHADIPIDPISPPHIKTCASLTSTPTSVHATLLPDSNPHNPSPIFAIPSREEKSFPLPDLTYLRSKAERSHSAGDWLQYLKFAAPPGSLPEQRYKDYKLAFLVYL